MNTFLLTAILLCLIGTILIVVEAHVPGFGIPGISGLICLLIGLYLFADGDVLRTIMYFFGAVAILVMGLWALYNTGYGRRYLKTFFLLENQSKESGYVSMTRMDSLVGLEGYVATPLRPAGSIVIENRKYDAVSDGEFIEKDEKIVVTMVEGRKILVKKLPSLT